MNPIKQKPVILLAASALLVLTFFACTKDQAFQFETKVSVKDWLLCGPFPNCEGCSHTDYQHGEQCTGFFLDYLESIGGEKMALPKRGVIISLPEKDIERKWFFYQSESERIPLNDIMTPNEMVVAYAFRQIESPKGQKVILAVGSNDGIQIFFNGTKVHENHPRLGRRVVKDNDLIPVHLKEGLNKLLLKIEDGTGEFGFTFRFLDYDSTLTSIRANIETNKKLTYQIIGDTILAQFGKPYNISLLNSSGEVNIELVHEIDGKLDERSVPPGEEVFFSIAGIPEGRIFIKAIFPTEQDGVLVSETSFYKGNLKRHPTAKMLNKETLPVSKSGEPFFPIGTYRARAEDYAMLKDIGYNFVMTSSSNLDKVQAAGLKACVYVSHDLTAFHDTVTKYKDHPAVLSWMLYDEPALNRVDILDAWKLYDTAYKLDPYHPSYVVLCTNTAYETYGRYGDVLCIDVYSIPNGDLGLVGGNIARAYEESSTNQPVWYCGQLFAWPGLRLPTQQEHRYNTYSALLEGAKGVLWFPGYTSDDYLPKDDPELWDFHKDHLTEINKLAPLFMAEGKGKYITSLKENPEIQGVLKTSSIGAFMIVINHSLTETFNPEFQVDLKEIYNVSVYGEDRTITVNDGSFKDQFKPLDVHIYKVK